MMKKKSLSVILLIAIFSLTLNIQNASAKSKSVECGEEIQTLAVKSDVAIVTVESVDETTAKKIDEVLMAQTPLTLKVKGTKKVVNKKLQQLQTMIGTVNKQGVIFQYEDEKKQGNYYTAKISKDNAKLYYYSVKYVEKLYDFICKQIRENYPGIINYSTYPEEETRKRRMVYDYLVYSFTLDKSGWEEGPCLIDGYDQATTYVGHCENDIYMDEEEYCNELILKCYYEDSEHCMHYILRSYEEFMNCADVEELYHKMEFLEPTIQEKLILEHNFGELSDAMKIYAIDLSGYFKCRFTRPEFGMMYEYTYTNNSGYKGMKALYENKASGVCEIFARYECQVFRQLGITCFHESSYNINHAWSVVKVKNSEGKTLWIPFDYGIGPSENLAVSSSQRKYIDTEEKRFKLYLEGIPGAPTKKNYTEADFN